MTTRKNSRDLLQKSTTTVSIEKLCNHFISGLEPEGFRCQNSKCDNENATFDSLNSSWLFPIGTAGWLNVLIPKSYLSNNVETSAKYRMGACTILTPLPYVDTFIY